ncbi:MAG: hypothetical protein MN733_01555 [Nitrososphaera sp.]|nr:hypothetical protein [Nitrososphaera sp.]
MPAVSHDSLRLLLALLVLSYYATVYAQEDSLAEPVVTAVQLGKKTVISLQGNWTEHSGRVEIMVNSSSPLEKVAASDWWEMIDIKTNTVTFRKVENTNRSSLFALYTNTTEPAYQYELIINSTKYLGELTPRSSHEDASWFVRWTDSEEQAASAYIPSGWKADLQIIRPYSAMTGFIFFARGEENSLAYVFQPFMPLHIIPDESLCDSAELCSATVSAEMVRELSFGNAPIVISHPKSSKQYFESEVLPFLRTNLNNYRVIAANPVYALEFGDDNRSDLTLINGLDIEYSFDVESKKISGRALVFTQNHTAGEFGFWNGYILGVESSEDNFDRAFQKAAVTLLTLRLEHDWLNKENQVLKENANTPSSDLRAVSVLLANHTLKDFERIIATAAHRMVRSYNDTMIVGFVDSETGEEVHLPAFPESQNWYLNNDQLLGRKVGRNLMNSSDLKPLFL